MFELVRCVQVQLVFFVRSGFITQNAMNYAGNGGYDWSSRATNSEANSYDLVFNENIGTSHSAASIVGRPLRCLSTVIDI